MTVEILNTRSLVSGFIPGALLEGQIFFNLPDRLMYVGDASNTQTRIDGSTTPCPPGEGWFEVALTIPELDDYFLISPQHFGDIPTNGQYLQWDTSLNHSVWNDLPVSGGASYQTTNSAVASAPGSSVSAKISNVIGVTAIEGDTVIVSGVSGDLYQGLYIYSGSVWNFAAIFASPIAENVPYNNTGTTLAATNVQAAITELDSDVVTAQNTADQAQADATQALSDAAAAQATADAALPLTGGTMTGPVTFAPGQSIPISGIPDASASTKGIVQIGSNVQVSSGVISVESASTLVPGIVQLNDTTSSTSTTQALTANQGRSLQQQINALVIANNITLGGTIDGSTGLVATVTPEGTLAGLTAGSALPAASSSNAQIFVIVTVTGTMTPPGGSATLVHIGDWWLSDGTSWVLLDVGYQYPYATTTQDGVVRLATNSEVQAGANTTHAIVPSSLQSKLSDSTSLTSSTTIASSTAVKAAYDAGVQGQTNAAAAQATANAALPKAGGVMTGTITFAAGQTIPVGSIQDGTLTQKGVVQLNNSTSSTLDTEAATPRAVKTAFDAAGAAQTDATQALADAAAAQGTANAALPLAGGTMSGAITFAAGQTLPAGGIQDATTSQKGVVQVGSNINVSGGVISVATATTALSGVTQLATNSVTQSGTNTTAAVTPASLQSKVSDSTSTTNSFLIASSTAVKGAYDAAVSAQTTADAALPLAGGTMTGQIAFVASQPISGGTY
jgi:hypothetical protein